MSSARPVGVLFVCLGNICRSPTAAAVFRCLVEDAGLSDRIVVDSAGTGAWHVGEGADRRATCAARRRGFDMTLHSARRVSAGDFTSFDHVVAMDHDNLAELSAIAPVGGATVLSLLMDYAPDFDEREVPDPYYGGPDGFDHVIDLIEAASRGLLDHLSRQLR